MRTGDKSYAVDWVPDVKVRKRIAEAEAAGFGEDGVAEFLVEEAIREDFAVHADACKRAKEVVALDHVGEVRVYELVAIEVWPGAFDMEENKVQYVTAEGVSPFEKVMSY